MKKTDKAYLAGLIDGEGCIFIAKTKKSKSVLRRGYRFQSGIHVVMTAPDIIKWVHQITGVGSVNKIKRRSPRHKIAHIWAVRDRKATFVLRLVKPFLRLKKKQAEILILFQNTMRFAGPRGATNSEWGLRKKYWKMMKKLNKRGA